MIGEHDIDGTGASHGLLSLSHMSLKKAYYILTYL